MFSFEIVYLSDYKRNMSYRNVRNIEHIGNNPNKNKSQQMQKESKQPRYLLLSFYASI